MKKQSGFTLIELMVVMAIIAILATAGLSAYTGYIKKARDATRIADLAGINVIILGQMTTSSLPPASIGALATAIKNVNNNALIKDPLTSGTTPVATCIGDTETTGITCAYSYRVCDGGSGYALQAAFESIANRAFLSENAAGAGSTSTDNYEIGNCISPDTTTSPNTAFATVDSQS